MSDADLKRAAINAAATIQAFYEHIDRIEAAGGATSLSGVAACHAFLKSMKANRKRVDELVIEPLRKEIYGE